MAVSSMEGDVEGFNVWLAEKNLGSLDEDARVKEFPCHSRTTYTFMQSKQWKTPAGANDICVTSFGKGNH
jgi:hypothetical protein